MTVSVFIPNYNHAPYLTQRIESVLAQSYSDFELILLDDASTDGSRDILENYRTHPRVKAVVYNAENSGSVFRQWLRGLELCTGDFVWIAESDDAAAPDFLESCVPVLEEEPALAAVFTNSRILTGTGQQGQTTEEDKAEVFAALQRENNLIHRGNLVDFLLGEMVIANASGVLFRRSAVEKTDKMTLAQFTNTGDRFVYLGLALQGSLRYLPQVKNYMRVHGRNTTTAGHENGNIHRDRLKVLRYYFEDFVQIPGGQAKVIRFYRNHFLSFLTWGKTEDNLAVLQKMRSRLGLSVFTFLLLQTYAYTVRKDEKKNGILRRVLYRVLAQLHQLNSEYQK